MARETSRREAQDRADRIRIFRQELDALRAAEVLALTEDQRAAVDSHLDRQLAELSSSFDIDVSDSQKQLSLGMRIVSALGGLALCAGVFLLFYRFWGQLATPLQVGILIAAPLLGLAAMDFASRRERTLYFTALIGLVTFACFVLNLIVLGQLFNIAPSPNAFLAWGAFAMILAYMYGLRLPLAAGLVCLIVFFAATLVSFTGAWWSGFGERPESILIPGILIALSPLLTPLHEPDDFVGVYPLVGLLTVFAVILDLWHNGAASWLPLEHKTVERAYQCIAFLSAGAVIWTGIRFNLRGTVNLGAGYFVVCLLIKLVDWWWDWMPKYLFFLLVGAIAIGLLTAFRKLRERTA